MHLIQILLPLFYYERKPLPSEDYRRVREELTDRFGGLTAYTRAPAEGLSKDGPHETTRDEIVVYEVMADELDKDWWRTYRESLEARFHQERIVVRAYAIQTL
ncbi:MAG: hypothetical protein H7Z74_15975 [Anaerolineae bacterium]|nr:hypothetical protein [Gemmatimonadaceae bacterium]